jgi:hypothetical protein
MYVTSENLLMALSELNFCPRINQHFRSDCGHRMADAGT